MTVVEGGGVAGSVALIVVSVTFDVDNVTLSGTGMVECVVVLLAVVAVVLIAVVLPAVMSKFRQQHNIHQYTSTSNI